MAHWLVRNVWNFSGLLILSCSVGCGNESADVTGSITYNGSEVTNGMITFTPTGEYGSVVGGKIQDGKFSVNGVFPGQNLVAVVATREFTFSQNSEEMRTTAPPQGASGADKSWKDPVDIIPRNAFGNNVAYDFVAGRNDVSLELKSPPLPN